MAWTLSRHFPGNGGRVSDSVIRRSLVQVKARKTTDLPAPDAAPKTAIHTLKRLFSCQPHIQPAPTTCMYTCPWKRGLPSTALSCCLRFSAHHQETVGLPVCTSQTSRIYISMRTCQARGGPRCFLLHRPPPCAYTVYVYSTSGVRWQRRRAKAKRA